MSRTRTPFRRPGRVLAAGTVPVTLLAVALLIQQATSAAFVSRRTTTGNSITSGSVALGKDVTGALFAATHLQRGSTGSRCVVVTYTGTLAAAVELYGTSLTGTLAPYLDLVIEQGSGGSATSCSGFTPSSTIFTGTLAAFMTASTSYASGVGTFAPSATGAAKTYRFTYTVQSDAPSSAGSSSVGATFTWEARST